MDISKHGLFYIIWIGGLTFLAGAINVCAALLFGMTVSHNTGNLSYAAITLGNGNMGELVRLFIVIISFFLGATIAGYLFHEEETSAKRYYSILPIIFGIVMIISFYVIHSKTILLALFALGMGAQNGTCLRVNGVQVRTTHITGYLTDAAFNLGAVLRGHRGGVWKVKFYLLSSLCFAAGGTISTMVIKMIGIQTVIVLAVSYIILGIYIHVMLVIGTEKEYLFNRESIYRF